MKSRIAISISLLVVFASPAHSQLLSHWRFDETSGPITFDSAGSVNGLLEGGAVFAPGQGIQGGAISLDPATNGRVNMGNVYGFLGSSFSIVSWVKLAPNDVLRGLPVSKHRATISQGYFLAVNDVNDGLGGSAVNKAHFWAGSSNNSYTPASTTVVNDGNWHQVVGVFNAGSNLKELYVDGVFQTSATHGPVAVNSAAFLIGGVDFAGTATGDFRGLIDDVRVYGNALTASEVFQIYQSVPEPGSLLLGGLGLASIWRFRRRR